jgi:RHS repeat-associated protein
VADFDGDGRPEIAITVRKHSNSFGIGDAGTFQDPTLTSLYVFRTDGTEVWHKDLTPGNGNTYNPPPAAFDFDGDGAAELVTQDMQYLYILDGRTGATRSQIAINNQQDLLLGEVPAIADVDNDGRAEIVAFASPAFPAGSPQRQGIVVVGDANGNWEHSRRSWNQGLYQPAFTNEDGSVPRHARNSWEVQNGLRTQIPLEGVDPAAAPDLSVSQVTVDQTNSPASATITARVGNGGSLQAGAGVVVDFYLGDPAAGGTLLGARTTTRPLFPGDFEDVSFTWNAPTAGQIVVTVNEPPPAARTPSADLALLPNTWAEASGFNQGSFPVNLNAYSGIDGSGTTAWQGINTSDPRPPFYQVHFPFPVEVSSVTIQNAVSTYAFLGTGTLTFSNGFSTSINLSATGAGAVTFPEQAGITWIRLTSSAAGTSGAGLAEFIAGGSYVQPAFLVPEGDGRLGNNSASLVLPAAPGALASPPPLVNAGPDQTVFDGDAVSLNPATFTDPVLLETHTATIDWGDTFVEPGTVREADGSGSVSGAHRYAGPGTYTVTVSVRDAAGNADSDTLTVKVQAAIYRQPAIDVIASDPAVSLVNLTGPVPGLATGQSAAFDVRLERDTPAAFDLLFVRPATGVLLGSIPVVVNSTYSYPVQALDGDGDPLTFRLQAAPAGATIDPGTGVIRWTPSQPGTYDFRVEASDGRGGTAAQSYQVTVSSGQPNQNPAITSTPPARAIVFRDFVYPVSASDPDGDPLAYFLTQAPAGMAIDRATGRITWRPDRSQVGTAAVTVSVRDPRGGQASQTFTLDVTPDPANQAPVFTSTAPVIADPGQLYSYAVTATDAENDPLSFDLPLRPAGMAIQPATGLLTWLPGAAQVGAHDVIVRVRDGNDGVTLQHFQVTVHGPNVPPVIVSAPPPQAVQGFPFEYRVQAEDTAGDVLTFHLDAGPAGATVDASTGVLSWVPSAAEVGTQSLSVTVVDDRGGARTQTFTVQVVASAANDPPHVLSTPRTTIALGGRYAYQVQAIDPDADPLTYHLDTAPAGMNIDASGLVTWQPTAAEFGVNAVVLRVDDGRGGSASQSFTVNVVTQLSDRPPAVVTTPPLTATVGRMYAYDAHAADPENDPVLWSLDSAPAGMSINPQLGTIRWTPTPDEVGLQTAVLRVMDAQGSSVVQSIPVIVRGVDVPPVITSTPPTQAAVGLAYTYQVQASDAEHDPLTFALTAAPAGMSINAVSGLIQWTPTAAQGGPQTVTVQADDGQGGIAVQTYAVVVSLTPPDQPPVITSAPRLLAIANSLYQYQVVASDPENEAVQFALVAAPAGMTIDPAAGLVEWTPGPQQAGQGGVLNLEVVTVTATDTAGNTATQRYTVSVRATNHAPVISSPPVTGAIPAALYGYDVQASDADGDPLTYRLDTGPQGMTLDAQGRLRWSPAAADAGPHPVALTVSDGLGGAVSQTFTVTVGPDTEAPRVSVQVSPNPVNVGAPATVVVSATDNVGVQTLDLTVNGTPVALDTKGRGTVTLSQVGAFDVVATATDAAGNTGTAAASLLVIDPTVGGVPTVELPPLPGDGVITAPVDVVGTASDTKLLSWSLSVGPVDGGPFREIVHGTTSVTNGVLGKLDPTLLANDNYILRLTATNAGGHTATADTPFSVMGNLKLGNFTLAFTDMTVPVSGTPITLTRTYDTLQAGTSEDFGFGWRLESRDVRLRTSVPKTGDEQNGIFNPFRDGTRVYVTPPGGQREGFTFRPTKGFLLGHPFYLPHFVPDPGVTDTLTPPGEVDNGNREAVGGFGTFVGLGGAITLFQGSDGGYYTDEHVPYNPAADVIGGVYFLTTKDGTRYQIDALSGNLESVTDRNGNTLTFTDAGITSSAGPAITFERDSQGRIAAVTDPMGNQVNYQYGPSGDLVGVTDRTGNTTELVYRSDRPHYLDHVIDALGRTGLRSDYDDQGRLKQVTNADNQAVQVTYDPSHDTETVLDALNNPTVYEYDDRGNILSVTDALSGVTQYTYDANNNVLTKLDPLKHTTTFTYDSLGNKLTETDPLENNKRYTYDARNHPLTITDALGNTTAFSYDANGNRLAETDPTGRSTNSTFDTSGNQISFTDANGGIYHYSYDGAGHLLHQEDALGDATDLTYDANGNKRTETVWRTIDGVLRQLTTTYAYDTNDRLTSTTDPLGGVRHIEYNALGQVKARVDALTRRTTYDYDPAGRLTQTTFPDGTTETSGYDEAGNKIQQKDRAGHLTTYVYDALNRLTFTIFPDDTPADLTDNPREQTIYDAAGNVKARIDANLNRTDFEYDKADRMTLTTQPQVLDGVSGTMVRPQTRTEYDATGNRTAVTDADGHLTQFTYDAAGRLTATLFLDGTSTQVQYDALGMVAAATDQEGRTTSYGYDLLGRLTSVTLPPPAAGADAPVTTYTYDEAGNQLTQTDALKHTTRFSYDELNRLVRKDLPMGQSESFGYDPVGNQIRHTDFNNATVTFAYDPMNRLRQKLYPDGSAVTFTYTPTGQRETVTDGRGTTTYTYDVRDRLTSLTDPDGRGISYTYDDAGNETSVTVPSGTTAYTYDALTRMESVTDPANGVTHYSYDPAGNLVRAGLPNGTVETRQYDDLNRLVFLQNSGPGGAVLSSYRYTLSPTGLRQAVTEDTGRTVTYTYDDNYRLTGESIADPVTGNRTIAYTYDAVGNRRTRDDSAEGQTTYTYDDNDRLRTETQGATVTTDSYDNNGNLRSRVGGASDQTSYTWDFENRLVAADVTDASGTHHLTDRYDADGNRVASVLDGEETRYLVDINRPFAVVLEEYAPGGTLHASYVYGLRLVSQDREGQRSFYLVDGLGSTRALTDASGLVTDRFVYDAFGRLLARVGNTKNDYLFAGEQLDRSVGLYNLRARYYFQGAGRFISRDSFEGLSLLPLTLHKYLYGSVDPVNHVDPSGRAPACPDEASGVLSSRFLGRVVHEAIGVHFEATVDGGLANRWLSTILGGFPPPLA